MNHTKSLFAASVHLLLFGVATLVANAQLPPIVWQTPDTLSKVYYSVKFSPDGSQVIAGGSERLGGSTDGVLIKRFDALTGAELATTEPNFIYYGAKEIALSPDGQRIITANFETRCTNQAPPDCEGGFLQYDAQQLTRLAPPPVGNFRNFTVDYSPDGQLIALGGQWYIGASDYRNLRLVRPDDLSIVRIMEGHLRGPNNGGTLSVRFSPDGMTLASCGHDRFVKLWRVSDGALLRAINFDDAYFVDSVAFSPDGQFIAAGGTDAGAQIKVWRVATGELVQTFNVRSDSAFTQFNKVAWTPDGRRVVAGLSFGVGYGNSQIKFWNFSTGELLQEYSSGSDNFINALTFSPNGDYFAYARSSKVFVATAPVSPQELISAVSRKTHGSAGVFDVNLPLSGAPAVEFRSGVAGHTLVFTFRNELTGGSASIIEGKATLNGTPSYSGRTMTLNLTDVANAQTVTVLLNNVTDSRGQTMPPTSVRVKLLLGDITGNNAVNASDVVQTKANIGAALTQATFRSDVTGNGTINSSDIAMVKAASGF